MVAEKSLADALELASVNVATFPWKAVPAVAASCADESVKGWSFTVAVPLPEAEAPPLLVTVIVGV
jgi:hypothetical protein